jgi:hypothetical protein
MSTAAVFSSSWINPASHIAVWTESSSEFFFVKRNIPSSPSQSEISQKLKEKTF